MRCDGLRRGIAEQYDAMARLRAAARRRADAIVFTGMGSSYDACYSPVTQLASRACARRWSTPPSCCTSGWRPWARARCWSPSASPARAPSWCGWPMRWRPPGDRTAHAGQRHERHGQYAGRAASIALDTRAGEEHGPSTMTFAAALVALCAVAGDGDGTAAAARQFGASTADDDPTRTPPTSRAWFGDRPVLALLGRGCARAAAEMGALTLKEAARLPAESLQTAQFRHGPLELAGPQLAAMVFATEPRTRHLDLGLAGELVAAGAARCWSSRRTARRRTARAALAVGPLGDRHRPRGRHPPRAAPGLAAAPPSAAARRASSRSRPR